MRHYEIVFLVHSEQSDQVPEMVKRYRDLVKQGGGKIHRMEDWGVRQLAYPVRKADKAHYVLMNIECPPEVLEEIKKSFQFNDAVIRNLVVRRDHAIAEASVIMQANKEAAGQSKPAQPG